MSVDGRGTDASQIRTNLSYTADETKPYIEGKTNSHPEEVNVAAGVEPVQELGVKQQRKGALIHDFCFGIPYGL